MTGQKPDADPTEPSQDPSPEDAAAPADPGVPADLHGATDDADQGPERATDEDEADVGADATAWTTTPVAPDPEATAAALAALAARPEVMLEPAETSGGLPPGASDEELPAEGTPVLLVGGILVGAFVVALAVVLLLFRPFDSGPGTASPTPSPTATASPTAGPTEVGTVETPEFTDMTLEDAEQTARELGLVLRVDTQETDEFEPGTVLSQDPPAGSVIGVGTTVDLVVASPVQPVAVPEI